MTTQPRAARAAEILSLRMARVRSLRDAGHVESADASDRVTAQLAVLLDRLRVADQAL